MKSLLIISLLLLSALSVYVLGGPSNYLINKKLSRKQNIHISPIRGGYSTREDGDEDDEDSSDEIDESVSKEPDNGGGRANDKAKVQYMVTSRMRNSLINDLGYLPEEVDMIEPQIAAVVIERALARPASGMPASWRKTNTAIATRDGAKPRSSRKKNSSKALGIPFGKIFGSISKIFHTVKYSLPVVAGVILFVKSGSLDKLRSIDFMRIIPNLSQLKTDRSESKVDSSVRSKFGISKQPRAQPPAKIPPSPPARSKPIKAAAPPSPPLPSSNNKHINVNALEAVQRRTWLEKIR